MISIDAKWAQIKEFADERGVSIQWVDFNGNYYLAAMDGPFSVEMTMSQENPEDPDMLEFIASYKDVGNKPPRTNVVQVLGKDDVSLSPRAINFVATGGGATTNIDKLIDTKMSVKGGVLFCPNASLKDLLQVQVIDKDNITGQGGTPDAPTVIAVYIKEWHVMPGVPNDLTDISISQPLPPGLYFRFIYISDPGVLEDRVGAVNLFTYEHV